MPSAYSPIATDSAATNIDDDDATTTQKNTVTVKERSPLVSTVDAFLDEDEIEIHNKHARLFSKQISTFALSN